MSRVAISVTSPKKRDHPPPSAAGVAEGRAYAVPPLFLEVSGLMQLFFEWSNSLLTTA